MNPAQARDLAFFQRNLHTMTAEEVERYAYLAGDKPTQAIATHILGIAEGAAERARDEGHTDGYAEGVTAGKEEQQEIDLEEIDELKAKVSELETDKARLRDVIESYAKDIEHVARTAREAAEAATA
jgi:septal ring factor EnvC (AmiA/AmiB activator)